MLAFTWPHLVPSLSALDSRTRAGRLRQNLDSLLIVAATHSFHRCERDLGAGVAGEALLFSTSQIAALGHL